MQIFKFGGASINSVERVKNVGEIIKKYRGEKMLIVISAMGKTTNALEKVTEAFFNSKNDEALELFRIVKNQHLDLAKYILITEFNICIARLNDFFTEIEWLLHDKPVREYDYYYDQIVCIGELLSSTIVSHYLKEIGIENEWMDVRDVFRTDDNFREAFIDWGFTQKRIDETILPILNKGKLVLTQGFIGATDENESTTLGREGSDFSAAAFANMLNAESVTIWKDVEGVMNADPKFFQEAKLIHELNYDEVIEMAYYGAQVIHPKTVKPLQNKGIPLYVKCFLDPELKGTVVHTKTIKDLPPIIVLKQDQVLMHLHSLDYSFVGGKPIGDMYEIMAGVKMKPNMMHTGAVTLQICMDEWPDKIEKIAMDASGEFEVQLERGLTLLTIRHYTGKFLGRLTQGKEVVLKQQDPLTVQVLMR